MTKNKTESTTSTAASRKPSEKATAQSRRRTQAERREEAELKLLKAARELVAHKGWVGMTLAEVGEAAGYSRGLAAHHFGNKSGLMRALAEYIRISFKNDQDNAPPREPGLDTIRGFVITYLSRTDPSWTNTRALLLLMAEATIDDSETGDILSKYNRQVVGFFEEHLSIGIEKGEIRPDVSPSASACLLMGTLRGIMLQKLTKNAEIDLLAIRDEMLSMITRMYAK